MTETIEAFALGSAASVDVATPPPSTDPLLAVLPFDNLSDDREMQFFSDGVSEEIIQRLSRGARMKVIGRTSSFQFRGADKNARNSGEGAAVLAHLDGSIRRAGGRVRIAAHLVEATSQTTLWSDRYDRSLEDIFAVQDEISEHIAAALDQTFTSFSTKAIDPAVYDLYLHASPESYAPEELRTNVGLLEVDTQRAPNFAEAWGRLAYCGRVRCLSPLPIALRAPAGGERSKRRWLSIRRTSTPCWRSSSSSPPSDGSSKPTRSWGVSRGHPASALEASTSGGTAGPSGGFAKAPKRRSAPSCWTR